MHMGYGRTTLLLTLLTLLLSACGTTQTGGQAAPATPAATADGVTGNATAMPDPMAGMDHGQMGKSSAPYDAQFIDSMLLHHRGAVTMAQQALTEAERPEIKELAATIIKDQEAEIAQMEGWRTAWYPGLAASTGMGMDMGTMEVANDSSKPFDQRFVEAMIPHHQGAITMARDAQQQAEHPEIKELAATIIAAQEAEIAQMRQWQQAWFGS